MTKSKYQKRLRKPKEEPVQRKPLPKTNPMAQWYEHYMESAET